MADASVTLEMLIKEGKAVIGLERLAAAQQKVEKGAAKIGNESKRADAELERFAKRTTQLNATPLEKFNVQMSKLEAALERGKIKHDIYTRAVFRAKEAFDQAGRSQQAALGPSFLGQIAQFTAGYLTLGRAVQVVGDAFRHAKQNSDSALSSLRGLDDHRKKLAQLATDMPAGSLAKMQERADAAAMSSGAPRSTAYEAMFQAHSFGFEKDYEKVMGMHPLIDAKHIGSVAKIRQMTGGTDDFRTIVNELIEGGKPSEVDAETLAGPMAIALEGGRRIGANRQETVGLLSGLTQYYAGRGEDQGEGKSGAARVAGDRLRAFGHKVATRLPHLKDKGFIGAFEAVRNMPESERADFMQENEEIASAYEAYGAGRTRVGGIIRSVERANAFSGTSQDNVAVGMAIRGADPKSNAAIEINRAEILKEIANEDKNGVAAAKRKAQAFRGEAAGFASNQGVLSQYGISAGGEAGQLFQASPQMTGGLQAAGAMAGSALNGDMASGGSGFWTFIGQLLMNQYKEAVNQTEILKDIRDQSPAGSTRAIEQVGLAPLH